MISRAQLNKDFRALGVVPGDMIMLHASSRSVGKVLGGADEIHLALMEVLAPHGTLMMYVGCESEFELVKGKYPTPNEEFILKNCPAFNPARARARHDYGILAEFFRSWPGVICSDNPGARVAALGPNAIWLTAEHPLDYGYGPASPLAKLYESHGKVLLLGSDFDQVTLLHYAEHIAPFEPKRIRHYQVPLLKSGKRVWVDIEEYDTSVGIRKWPERFFEKIIKEFIKENSVEVVKVGEADSYLLDARLLIDFAVPVLLEAAKKYAK